MGRRGSTDVSQNSYGFKYIRSSGKTLSNRCFPPTDSRRASLLVASVLSIAVAQSLVVVDSVALAQSATAEGSTQTLSQINQTRLSEVNAPTSTVMTHSITMESSRAEVDANHQEVDTMSERIKEMIEARYRAESVLFKNAQQTMIALRQRIEELEQYLYDANGKHDALLAERDDLNQQLSLVQAERDSARDDITVLAGEIDNQRGTVDTLRTNVATAADQLADRENQLKALTDKLDVQQVAGEQLEGTLDATEDKLKDKGRQLALAEERLADTRQQLRNTRDELSGLKTERNKALDEIANLRVERDTADKRANSLLSERESLTGKLGLFQSQTKDVSGALEAEQQQHAQSRATVAALEDDIVSLQGDVEARTKQRDELLAQKKTLEGEKGKLTADLDKVNGKLQFANKELQNRKQDLQAARTDLEDVTSQLTVARAELEDLNDQLASSHNEIGKLNSHIGKLDDKVAKLTTDRAQAKASISSLKSNGVSLQGELDKAKKLAASQLASVQSELKREKGALQKQLDRRDRDLVQLNSRVSELVAELNDISSKAASDVSDRDGRIADLEQQLKALQGKRTQLLAESERADDTMENLHNLIASLESKEQATADKLAALQSRYDKLQGNGLEEAKDLRVKLSQAEGKLRDASAQLNALLLEKSTVEAERDAVFSEAEKLRATLTAELQAAKLENVTVQNPRADNSIPLRLGNADFFAVGSAELTKKGSENLKKLAEIISTFEDRRIVVEGHTDNLQIRGRLKNVYATNWELSVARAAAAVRHMQYQSNIDPHQLSAVGYGEYAPVASNETFEGRQLNRRVEVVLYPREVTEQQFSAIED